MLAVLARTVYVVRKRVGGLWGLAAVMACVGLLAIGFFSGERVVRGDPLQVSVMALFAVALVRATSREISIKNQPTRHVGRAWTELELGLLLLTAVYLLLASTGGVRSFLYPLVYALVSFLMVVHRSRPVVVAWLAGVTVLEIALALGLPSSGRWTLVGYHLTFIGFFAAGNALVLSGVVRRLRSDHARRIDSELERMRQEARDFRLIASQLPLESRSRSREDEELRMARGAVESIHEQLFHHLDLLRSALSLHTCVLLWAEDTQAGSQPESNGRLTIKEMATSSELIAEQPSITSPGLLTTVLREPKPLRLKALAGKRVPPYYGGPERVTDLCAVPLLDGASLRGILCADRNDDRPFSMAEEETVTKAAVQLLRIIEHERVFTAVERGKYEQEQFYRASELLNQALTVEDVYQKTFAAVRAMAHYELAAITSFDDHAGRHTVIAVDTGPADSEHRETWLELAGRLRDLSFEDGTGLISMAVKNRHYMPATGELVDADTVVFNGRTRLRRARSLLVLPLVHGDRVLGSVVLASVRPHCYSAPIREMLRVLGHQVGVSLQNARMYQSMELRATTDGLTGLTNHRAFQERLARLHALCERTGQKYAMILTDIDHFKSVNDTYGHPVGDQVLKRVAGIFAGRARKVDIVARYGGEEFVLVLPDTDGEGAAHFANMLRDEVASQTMTSEHGTFSVTVSMGVAEFPADGRDRQELIERADQALYHCKEHGRNCVKRSSQMS